MPGDRQHLVGMLLHHDHPHRAGGYHSRDHAEQFLRDQRGEALERLVEQEQPGIEHQRACDRQHLLLAAGELVAHVASTLAQPREQRVDARERPFAGARDDGEVLLDGQRREDVALLRHPPQACARAAVAGNPDDVLAGEADDAAALACRSDERCEQRRLAHAVAAEEREASAFVEREAHVLQDDRVAVTAPHVLHPQELTHGRLRPDRAGARAGRS